MHQPWFERVGKAGFVLRVECGDVLRMYAFWAAVWIAKLFFAATVPTRALSFRTSS